jgi:hypothetical protein
VTIRVKKKRGEELKTNVRQIAIIKGNPSRIKGEVRQR